MRPSTGQKVSMSKSSFLFSDMILEMDCRDGRGQGMKRNPRRRNIQPPHELSVGSKSAGRTSCPSSVAPSRCSRRKGHSPHESLPPEGGISAYHADANSQRLHDTPCHLDLEIWRPFPELGAHRVHSRAPAGHAPVLSASWLRTKPTPVVRPQQRLASKPKRSGTKFSSFLQASDINTHENHLAVRANVRRDKDQLHCAYRQAARCNDGTQQNADRATRAERDRGPRRYNLKYLARLLRRLFPWFPRFIRSPSQASILSQPWGRYVPQHQTSAPKPTFHGSRRYSQNGGCFRDAQLLYIAQHECLPVVLRQRTQRLYQGIAYFHALQGCRGNLTPVFEVLRDVRFRIILVGGHGQHWYTPQFSISHSRLIDRYLDQPGTECRLFAKLTQTG